MKQFNRALADYDRALALDPNLADAYNNRGILHLARGDVEAAQADFSAAIAINPAHALAYYNRGIALRLHGDLEDSKKDLEQAATLTPRLRDSVRMLVSRTLMNEKQALESPSGNPP